jgi:hypothetical protein
MSKKKAVTPSRKKYDEEHPIVSFRLPWRLKKKLQQHLAASGQSSARFIRSILDEEIAVVNERLNARIDKKYGRYRKEIDYYDHMIKQSLDIIYDDDMRAFCPRCDEKNPNDYTVLLPATFLQKRDGSPTKCQTWRCPCCGWYYDMKNELSLSKVEWLDEKQVSEELLRKKEYQSSK